MDSLSPSQPPSKAIDRGMARMYARHVLTATGDLLRADLTDEQRSNVTHYAEYLDYLLRELSAPPAGDIELEPLIGHALADRRAGEFNVAALAADYSRFDGAEAIR